MSMEASSNIGNYTFPVTDSIENFRINVHLWREDDETKVEHCDIRWKDPKVFSMMEIEKYKKELPPNSSDFEKLLKELFDDRRRRQIKLDAAHRIFTSIDSEINEREILSDVSNAKFTDYEKEVPTIIEESIKRTEKWQTGESSIGQQEGGQIETSASNIILDQVKGGSDDFIRRIFKTSVKQRSLEIKLDSRSDLTSENPESNVLCTITFTSPNSITVSPDFTTRNRPHKCGKWRYSIENGSRQTKDLSLLKEADSKARKQRQQFVSNMSRLGNFDLISDPKTMKVFVFGEIISAREFQFDSLYVSYFIDLFQNWKVSPSSSLSGTTQISNTKTETIVDVAHFSYPFEFELTYETPYKASSLETFEFPQHPAMYFEVMSRDMWTRHRCEGYTFMRLPSTPGFHAMDLPCWRPTGTGVLWELRRFFIGGTPELDDATFCNIPTAHEGSLLSRFGFSTEATGTLNVRMHVVHQNAPKLGYQQDGSARDISQHRRQRDGLAGAEGNVEIMQALMKYRTAREKLLTVRQAVKEARQTDIETRASVLQDTLDDTERVQDSPAESLSNDGTAAPGTLRAYEDFIRTRED